MSAIAGICYWDGRPVPNQLLAVLASYARLAGSDGGGTVSPVPGLALQAYVWHFDQLSTGERQPHVFSHGSVLTWDGRLDNRRDLLARLHHDLGADITDAALVAAAYVRWGVDSFPRLIGDWSLAIWDAPNRRIVLARDYMGNRPLHHLEVPGGLAWSTSLDALAEGFNLYGKPDEDYIIGRLTNRPPPHVTPFEGARVLRSGHLLLATPNSPLEIRRYWTFQPSRIRYHALQDYADHARELLTEAVQVRLRVRGRVWSHLSGGFDSSSIVCLAQTLVQRQFVEASAIQPISIVYPRSPESDESPFIEAVERWCELTTIRREVHGENTTFAELLARRRPFAYRAEDTLEAPMVAAGDRVVLSGEAGDLVMVRASSQVVSLLEVLHDGHPIRFLRLCLARARKRRLRLLPLLKYLLVHGYLSRDDWAPSRRPTAPALHATGVYREGPLTERLMPAVLARASAHRVVYPSVSGFPVAKRALVKGLYGFTDLAGVASSDLTPEIWTTFPFTHRPLVEFITGVPQLAFWDAVVARAGMKRALKDVLPPELLTRSSKGDPHAAKIRRELAGAAEYAGQGMPQEPTGEWQLVTRGYVRPESLARAADAVRAGLPPSKFLRLVVQLEAWLRATGDSRPERRLVTPTAVTDLVGATHSPG